MQSNNVETAMFENKLIFAAVATMVAAGVLWLVGLVAFLVAPALPWIVAIGALVLIAGLIMEFTKPSSRHEVMEGGESVTLADEDEPEEEMRKAA
jgi:hypothetical protein